MSCIPLTKLSPLQSIGYLEDGQRIDCIAPLDGFTVGQAYAVRPFQITVRRTVRRPSIAGPEHVHILTGKDIAVAVGDDARRWRLFVDGRHFGRDISITNGGPFEPEFTFEQLVKAFAVPAPPDIAEVNPAHYEYNLRLLEAIEQIVNGANTAPDP